jgi:hypothetical protein
MVPQVASNVAQQLKQIAQDTFENIGDQPKEFADEALEQIGFKQRKGQTQKNPQQKAQDDFQAQLKKRQEQDEQQSGQQIMALRKELEAEIKKWQQIRDEQLIKRREKPEPTPEEIAAQQAANQSIKSPEPRKAKGSWMQGAKRRVQSAWEQFAPEQAGKRGAGG